MFLDAVLKENGQEAVVIYQDVVDNHPKSKYADAALYRIFPTTMHSGCTKQLRKIETAQIFISNITLHQVADQNLSALEKSEIKEQKTVVDEVNPKVEEDYKFTIQAGAFTNLDNANNLSAN